MLEPLSAVPARVLQRGAQTASAAFYVDGTLIDPGTVTVGITREDGSVVVAPLTATTGTGAAARTYALTATHTATLDTLTITWTSATLGTLITYTQVVGGFLFSLNQARALSPLSNATTYPTADVLAARTLAEMALEDACGVSFVPRYFRETVDGRGGTDVMLANPRPLTITSVTTGASSASAGSTLSANQITDLRLYPTGIVYNAGLFAKGRGNVAIVGTAGYLFPPPRVGRACLLLAKRFLVDSPINDRAVNIVSSEGSQFLVTAGVRGAVTDVPECNAVIEEYGMKVTGA